MGGEEAARRLTLLIADACRAVGRAGCKRPRNPWPALPERLHAQPILGRLGMCSPGVSHTLTLNTVRYVSAKNMSRSTIKLRNGVGLCVFTRCGAKG